MGSGCRSVAWSCSSSDGVQSGGVDPVTVVKSAIVG